MDAAGRSTDGRYQLIRRLTRASPSWLARDELLGRDVALTPVPADGSHRAAALAGTRDPHLTPVLDVVPDGDQTWLASTYRPADSLAHVLTTRGPLPTAELVAIGTGAAAALAAAHRAGVTHHEISAHTVLLDPTGAAELTAFDVAAAGDPADDVRALGETLLAAMKGHVREGGGAEAPVRPGPHAPQPLVRALTRLVADDPAPVPTAEEAARIIAAVRVVDVERRARTRRRLRVVAAVAGIAAIVAGLCVAVAAVPPAWLVTSAPAAPATPVHDALGVPPRLADPCSLLDPAALAPYGAVTPYPDDGPFAGCIAGVIPKTGAPDRQFFVLVQFAAPLPPDQHLVGSQARDGTLRIARTGTYADGTCDRTVVLADGELVLVHAYIQKGAFSDMCGPAEAATAAALKRLRGAGVGLRDRPIATASTSLTGLDACALADRAVVAAAGFHTGAQPGFAGWSCTWDDGPAELTVTFARYFPLAQPGDGTLTVDRRRYYFTLPGTAPDDDECLVTVPQHNVTAPGGDPRSEVVQVRVTDPAPNAPDRCRRATDVAKGVATRLPVPP